MNLPLGFLAGYSYLPGMGALRYLLPKHRKPQEFTEEDQAKIDAARSKQERKAAKRLKGKKNE